MWQLRQELRQIKGAAAAASHPPPAPAAGSTVAQQEGVDNCEITKFLVLFEILLMYEWIFCGF
jgi:hypothetical protein